MYQVKAKDDVSKASQGRAWKMQTVDRKCSESDTSVLKPISGRPASNQSAAAGSSALKKPTALEPVVLSGSFKQPASSKPTLKQPISATGHGASNKTAAAAQPAKLPTTRPAQQDRVLQGLIQKAQNNCTASAYKLHQYYAEKGDDANARKYLALAATKLANAKHALAEAHRDGLYGMKKDSGKAQIIFRRLYGIDIAANHMIEKEKSEPINSEPVTAAKNADSFEEEFLYIPCAASPKDDVRAFFFSSDELNLSPF